jgi:hypothetical protein
MRVIVMKKMNTKTKRNDEEEGDGEMKCSKIRK